MIPRGCTATNTFSFPYEKEYIEALFVTYQQMGKTVLEKPLDSVRIEAVEEKFLLVVPLSQDDTLCFNSSQPVEIQIRVKLKDGTATKSNVLRTSVDRLLKDGRI